MKKLLLFTALLSSGISCFGQVYAVRKQTVLAGTAEVITIQQPATLARQVTFISAYFDCSVACSFTLERNGTAATSTTLAVNNVNPGETAAATTAWSASNVGVGTVLASYNCPGACSIAIDLTGVTFAQVNGTGVNLTLRSSSITGTVDIIFKYSEKTL
jgi:hypothetical protein